MTSLSIAVISHALTLLLIKGKVSLKKSHALSGFRANHVGCCADVYQDVFVKAEPITARAHHSPKKAVVASTDLCRYLCHITRGLVLAVLYIPKRASGSLASKAITIFIHLFTIRVLLIRQWKCKGRNSAKDP